MRAKVRKECSRYERAQHHGTFQRCLRAKEAARESATRGNAEIQETHDVVRAAQHNKTSRAARRAAAFFWLMVWLLS